MTNKFSKGMMIAATCVLAMAGALLWTGCDTASATEGLTLSPSSVVLASGQSQLFTVSGGYHYTWSILSGTASGSNVAANATGSLSSLTGSEVRYFAPTGDALSGSVIIQVTSTIEGSSSGTSNSPAYAVTGQAVVSFK